MERKLFAKIFVEGINEIIFAFEGYNINTAKRSASIAAKVLEGEYMLSIEDANGVAVAVRMAGDDKWAMA